MGLHLAIWLCLMGCLDGSPSAGGKANAASRPVVRKASGETVAAAIGVALEFGAGHDALGGIIVLGFPCRLPANNIRLGELTLG